MCTYTFPAFWCFFFFLSLSSMTRFSRSLRIFILTISSRPLPAHASPHLHIHTHTHIFLCFILSRHCLIHRILHQQLLPDITKGHNGGIRVLNPFTTPIFRIPMFPLHIIRDTAFIQPVFTRVEKTAPVRESAALDGAVLCVFCMCVCECVCEWEIV